MVDRFTITAAEQDPWIDADPNGQWVRYTDYAALEAKLAALSAENERRIRSAVCWSLEASKYDKKLDEAHEREARQAEKLRLAASRKERSEIPGELRDKIAEAIRSDGTSLDDDPWETLPEERKDWWREDADRVLSAIKDYLIPAPVVPAPEAQQERPAEQAVTEAMVETMARWICEKELLDPDFDDGDGDGPNWQIFIDDARDALKAAMKARD